jgi:hypothetical protein
MERRLEANAYNDRDEMIRIEEPGVSIVNAFDGDGRCVLNDVRLQERDGADRRRETAEVFKFRYTLDSTGPPCERWFACEHPQREPQVSGEIQAAAHRRTKLRWAA